MIPNKPGGVVHVNELIWRERKAGQLTRLLREHNAGADEAERLSPEMRALVAQAAGVKVPSDATWAIVVARLASTTEPSAIEQAELRDGAS